MLRPACLAALLLAWAAAAAAQDYIATRQGPLDDDAFYRLVACAAAPGAPCQRPVVRWPQPKAQMLRVGITRTDPGFPPAQARLIRSALTEAIAELNASGARIRLSLDGMRPDIRVLLLDVPENTVLRRTGIPGLDGQQIEAAYVYVWWNNREEITRAAIVFSRDLTPPAIRSTVLEELTQSLGLLTDISNPWYTDRSIFSQEGYRLERLGDQDIVALRRHYPR